MNQKLFKRLEIFGGAVVFAMASLLHFIYDLSGRSVLGALFGAVNESVWEHLKIFALAYMAWAIIELLWARPFLGAFVWAKALGLYALCLGIAGFFYLYTPLVGKPIFVVDLISALFFSFSAHYISYRVTLMKENHGQNFFVGVMMLLLALVMIICFTYYPPKTPLFKDPVTGLYGIPSYETVIPTGYTSLSYHIFM
ncbi:MAG: hypothetical protein IKJ83_04865 [Ruminococcus sp.]|nr:hypothetical protein [Ruminococcus sp.]